MGDLQQPFGSILPLVWKWGPQVIGALAVLIVGRMIAGEDDWALRYDLTRKLREELEAGGCSIRFPGTRCTF